MAIGKLEGEKEAPKDFLRQVWRLYGIRQRDAVTSLVALPAGLQVVSQLVEELNLAELFRRFILAWREVTRLAWEAIVDAARELISWDIYLTDAEKDALTLTLLAGGAAVSSALLRRGESLGSLLLRSGPYPLGVRSVGLVLIVALVAFTALTFLRISFDAVEGLTHAIRAIQPTTGMAALASIAFYLWARRQGEINVDERIYFGIQHHLVESASSVLRVHGASRWAQQEWRRKGGGGELTDDDLVRSTECVSVVLENALQRGRRSAYRWFVITLTASVLFLVGLGVILLLLLGYQIGGRTATFGVYLVALIALIFSVAVNWRSLPVIYVNVIGIVLLNYAVVQLGPIVQAIDAFISSAGG